MSRRREFLTIAEFCDEAKIARSTFYEWKGRGVAPRCTKLPNGQLRIDRRDADQFFDSCSEAA